jgi:peptidoglycan/xylan/chitin deacetylase (PgdA/CDA1 family)
MSSAQKGSVKNGLVITTEDFDREMSILKQAGYDTIGFDDLYAYIEGKENLSNKDVVITFDDGYRTCGYLAAPILRKYGFRATIFIITNKLSQPDDALNTTTFSIQFLHADELPLFADVFDYASHTDNMHNDYKGQPMLISEPPSKILNDLELSRQKLNNTTALAYPFGKYSDETITLLKQAGFRMAFTTQPKIVEPGIDPYKIPRFEINEPITDTRFKKIMGIV